MKRKSLLTLALCLLIAFSTVLAACGGDSDNGDETTARPRKTTERTEATTAATTAPMVTATDLVPQIDKADTNQILSRLTKPLTVNIDENTTIDLQYQGWPTVCKGEDGTLYAEASARVLHVDPFGVVVFYESHDNGKTWSEPSIVYDSPLDDRDAGIVYLGNGKILVSWFTNLGQSYIDGDLSSWRNSNKISDEQEDAYIARFNQLPLSERQNGSYVILSEDYGKTWGEPIQVPVSAPHGPTLGKDGKLYYLGTAHNASAAGFSSFNGSRYLYVISSADGGRTWREVSALEKPTTSFDFCEPYIIQLTDGSFIAAIRVAIALHDTTDPTQGMCTFTATSKDGRNWTSMARVSENMWGGPPHLLQLSNGVVLLTYGCRITPTCSIRYRLSYDGGKTWSSEELLTPAHNPNNNDMGYPSTVELEDGTLLTAYYQTYRTDGYCSFLYTTWKLVEQE